MLQKKWSTIQIYIFILQLTLELTEDILQNVAYADDLAVLTNRPAQTEFLLQAASDIGLYEISDKTVVF